MIKRYISFLNLSICNQTGGCNQEGSLCVIASLCRVPFSPIFCLSKWSAVLWQIPRPRYSSARQRKPRKVKVLTKIPQSKTVQPSLGQSGPTDLVTAQVIIGTLVLLPTKTTFTQSWVLSARSRCPTHGLYWFWFIDTDRQWSVLMGSNLHQVGRRWGLAHGNSCLGQSCPA